MPPEARLRAALDALPAPVVLWWRDDDAGRDHPRLATLLDLSAAHGIPICLAVVPDWLTDACAERIRHAQFATVVQHGVAHADHAVPPNKKIELGGTANRAELGAALLQRRERLADAFGDRFVPALVPPWNRIAPELIPALPSLGFAGLSVYGPRRAASPAPGLRLVNTHVDLIAWRDGSRSLGPTEIMEQLAQMIETGTGEPLGILSHHLAMDASSFAALDHLLAGVLDHPHVRWAQVGALFEEG
ncbi:MAG: polysaccharide deacetylase family protein [Geminicoccaceae bacterium]